MDFFVESEARVLRGLYLFMYTNDFELDYANSCRCIEHQFEIVMGLNYCCELYDIKKLDLLRSFRNSGKESSLSNVLASCSKCIYLLYAF